MYHYYKYHMTVNILSAFLIDTCMYTYLFMYTYISLMVHYVWIQIQAGLDVCHRSCTYVDLRTAQMPGMCSAGGATMIIPYIDILTYMCLMYISVLQSQIQYLLTSKVNTILPFGFSRQNCGSQINHSL